MLVIESLRETQAQVMRWRADGKTIGLVPTMGALHNGHLSLVRRSKGECDLTAATIFVNPTQFGPEEDFSRYPRPLDEDLRLLRDMEVDLVFVPQQHELYPADFSTTVNPPDVAQELEGKFRPGHFRGVATIVLKLFHILPASAAYFGQKDYQQLAVIRRMVQDLNLPIRIEGCPTVREADGLAMSSRNRYLSSAERSKALGLWAALQAAAQLFAQGQRAVHPIEQRMMEVLHQHGVESVDYARVVDADWLRASDNLNPRAVALVAARVGNTRLIDNLLLESSEAYCRGDGDG